MATQQVLDYLHEQGYDNSRIAKEAGIESCDGEYYLSYFERAAGHVRCTLSPYIGKQVEELCRRVAGFEWKPKPEWIDCSV